MSSLSTAQLDALLAANTEIVTKVDIYEADGETLWMADAPLISGSVSVDAGRDDRRTSTMVFYNEDGALDHTPHGLWYNKIIKPYRGFVVDGSPVAWQQGEFMVETIVSQNFPHTVSVTMRDYAKLLMQDKFGRATSFASGQSPEGIIQTIATNAGITKMIIPSTGRLTGKTFTFESETTRMKAIHDIATAYGYEVFFDAHGYMVMREYVDPLTTAPSFTFDTGQVGTLVSIKKRSTDSRIYNHVVVTGGDSLTLPIIAEAENNDTSSPTHIDRETGGIGRRTYRYTSSFINTQDQAQDVADKFLKIHALEEYEMDVEALVVPNLEASEVIEILDPDPDPEQPTNYFLHDFTVPLGLGLMKLNGRRVTHVG